MPEPERMDSLLRQTLAADTLPTLSPTFHQRLEVRLQPRRLSAKSRLFLILYCLVGLAISVWTMWVAGIHWILILLTMLIPLVTVAIMLHRHFLTPRRRMSKRL